MDYQIELEKNETILKYDIIKYLTNYYYKFYGLKDEFEEKELELNIYKNNIIFCRAKSVKNELYKYKIYIQVIPELYSDFYIKKNKKCIYCDNNNCESRLSCCDLPVHPQCAKQNDFQCSCSNKKNNIPEKNILEIKKNKENDNNCIVCYEECNTQTSCGHRLCKSCFDSIYKIKGGNTKCPYCRTSLINNKETKIFEVQLKRNLKIKALVVYKN